MEDLTVNIEVPAQKLWCHLQVDGTPVVAFANRLREDGELEVCVWGLPIERKYAPMPLNEERLEKVKRARKLGLTVPDVAPEYAHYSPVHNEDGGTLWPTPPEGHDHLVLPSLDDLQDLRDNIVDSYYSKDASNDCSTGIAQSFCHRYFWAQDSAGDWWGFWVTGNLLYQPDLVEQARAQFRAGIQDRDMEEFRVRWEATNAYWAVWQRHQKEQELLRAAQEKTQLAKEFGLEG